MRRVFAYWPVYVGLFYFVPIFLCSGYAAYALPLQSAWPFFTLSLAIGTFGTSLALGWGYRVQEYLGMISPKRRGSRKTYALINRYQERIAELEGALEEEREYTREELESERKRMQEQFGKREKLLQEVQQQTHSLQQENEKKQRYAAQLENKIRDLSYEIKTLLQLADIDEEKQENFSYHGPTQTQNEGGVVQESTTPYTVSFDAEKDTLASAMQTPTQMSDFQATKLLQRCVDLAQKMTGSHHFGHRSGRIGTDYGTQAYTLDLRHLFDRLRIEGGGVVLVYSRQEGKMIFVSEEIRDWLGWSPEKFTQNFPFLVQEGYETWEQTLVEVTQNKERHVTLLLKSREGQDRQTRCQLGIIPTGLFKGYLLGVMY